MRVGITVCILCATTALAQDSGRTVRKHRVTEQVQTVSPLVTDAESELEKNDLAQAEDLLKKQLAVDPKDHRAWFDLGYVYKGTGRPSQAVSAYTKSAELKPTLF